ncbi:hypothetical protein [Thermogemmata fonticola]|uniref:Uncharacterized protein n=1 Tax=Thermogemmata fonticola TaxID=2755323 RepID=A0A7V8VBE0_9BACT|nr:hypothetical protein [Thermogemmata fonticola]MBA2224930.1 hypothetical protein [Thermogemmata fonticola]
MLRRFAMSVWFLLPGLCLLAQPAPPLRELTWENFDPWHQFIKPQPGECRFWQVHWQTDVHNARLQAAKEGKPLLILSGHRGSPLGNCRWSVSAARDPAVWNEEFTRLVKERCIAVTVPDAGTVRKRQDAVGTFFRNANVGSTALTSNFCMDVVTASGKHLGRIAFNTPGVALGMLKKALQTFDSLPEADKRGPADLLQDNQRVDDGLPKAPAGTLILRVYLRQLGRNSDGTIRYTQPSDYTEKTPERNRKLCREPFDDTMWVLAEEGKALIANATAQGQQLPVPESLQLRLFRYHLNPRVGFTEGPCFAKATTKDGRLTVSVEYTDSEEIRLRVEGQAKLQLGDDLTYEPVILGKLVYSRSQAAFTRFDLVALGKVTGHIQHGGGGYRPGAQPLGIAFELVAKPRPTDRLPPGGAGDAAYLKPK